jgi:hypothetical protein
MDEGTQMLVDALIENETAVGGVITWAGADYSCFGGGVLGGKSLEMGGFRLTAQTQIVVRQGLFAGGATPAEKETLVYKSYPGASGRTLRIQSVDTFRDGFLVLECNDVNQSA